MRITIFFICIFSQMAFARLGNDQGNGGDLYSAEFVEIGQKVVELLRNNGSQDLDIEKLEAAVNSTEVESTEETLELNHIPKDAINYPAEDRILFNRGRWRELDSGEKPTLVLHEYLGILGIEDASYRFSKRILGSFKYDIGYLVDCGFDGGNLNFGIDESAGLDVILLIVNWQGGKMDIGEADLSRGNFSKMIRDGNLSINFDGNFLVSLQGGPKPMQMNGSFAGHGKVLSILCGLRKVKVL